MFLMERVGRGQGPPSAEGQERWKLISLGTLVPFQGTLLNDVFNGHTLKCMRLYYWVGKGPSSSQPCSWSCHSWRCWCILLSTEPKVLLFITWWEEKALAQTFHGYEYLPSGRQDDRALVQPGIKSLPLGRCQGRPSVSIVMVIKGFRTCHNFGRISPHKTAHINQSWWAKGH